MRGQAGLFDVDERLKELSAKGDHLERLNGLVNFELFRADLEQAVPRADRSRGGRPPFDHVFMFKVLVLQASHSLSDERTEFLIKDRLSVMRPTVEMLLRQCLTSRLWRATITMRQRCRDGCHAACPGWLRKQIPRHRHTASTAD